MLLLLLLFATACTTQRRSPEAQPAPGASFEATATELLQLVNQERQRGATCGEQRFGSAAPLSLEPRLVRAARLHSSDMRSNDFMGHGGSDGSTVGVRATRQGYEWREVAENVAFGYPTAAQVMAGWMDSPGHCRAIMGPNYQELGAAEDGNFWTLVFAEPL